MSELDYIADAMIEASGALRMAATGGNEVSLIIAKLDRAIAKARALKDDGLISKSEALAYVGDIMSQVETPPPIPTQDLGKADQSPARFSVPESAYHNTPARFVIDGDPNVYEIDDEAKTRIVHRQPTDDGHPVV